jgi:hypothetical protein
VSVTIDLPEGLLAGVYHVPEPEVPRQVLIGLAGALYAHTAWTQAQAAALAGSLGEQGFIPNCLRWQTKPKILANHFRVGKDFSKSTGFAVWN